ncbi:hypothetical protein SAMN05421786_103492 [Chryseobacterium ureilyticum]|uniref:Uncharacterized protein n=1 Tax=Chryseobacterium ureilyticum TaxID=373668 RepID=A0A1N7NFD5_9FLAO|nr:hypothetical protein SAMN05421786_103492 [Chryseobacterium ureilyticum]
MILVLVTDKYSLIVNTKTILKTSGFTHFIKNLYLCHNELLKMDIGNLFHGVITDAM